KHTLYVILFTVFCPNDQKSVARCHWHSRDLHKIVCNRAKIDRQKRFGPIEIQRALACGYFNSTLRGRRRPTRARGLAANGWGGGSASVKRRGASSKKCGENRPERTASLLPL